MLYDSWCCHRHFKLVSWKKSSFSFLWSPFPDIALEDWAMFNCARAIGTRHSSSSILNLHGVWLDIRGAISCVSSRSIGWWMGKFIELETFRYGYLPRQLCSTSIPLLGKGHLTRPPHRTAIVGEVFESLAGCRRGIMDIYVNRSFYSSLWDFELDNIRYRVYHHS